MTENITIALTSCGRFKSLEKTIKSIEQTIDLSKYEKIMTEDSKNETHIKKIKEVNENGFLKGWKIFYTGGSGQTDLYKCHYYALKKLYENINTDYVFHCEDDQIFKKMNYNYLEESKNILEENRNIGLVLLRDLKKDFGIKKTGIMKSRYYELLTDEEFHYNNKKYVFCTELNSFSLQPGLRRTDEMKKIMFGFEDFVNEDKISKRYNKLGLKTILIENGIYNHIQPLLNSTKNISNLGFFNFIYITLKGTLKYRIGLVIKFIKQK
ncbi:MAG: hypothetical protein AB7E37_00820 [Candidatus Altimarinota bacterium]